MPELLGMLKEQDLGIPIVVGGSVITPEDRKKLKDMGVAVAFGPSVTNEEIVKSIQQLVVTT